MKHNQIGVGFIVDQELCIGANAEESRLQGKGDVGVFMRAFDEDFALRRLSNLDDCSVQTAGEQAGEQAFRHEAIH